MKLQMNDTNKTVITSINTGITSTGDFDETRSEYFNVITINGLELRYYGKDRSARAAKDLNKLRSKGAVKAWTPLPTSEEEQGWADGTAADCADPAKHGHTVAVILAGENSSHLVWDWNLQKCVDKKDLTPAPRKRRIRKMNSETYFSLEHICTCSKSKTRN